MFVVFYFVFPPFILVDFVWILYYFFPSLLLGTLNLFLLVNALKLCVEGGSPKVDVSAVWIQPECNACICGLFVYKYHYRPRYSDPISIIWTGTMVVCCATLLLPLSCIFHSNLVWKQQLLNFQIMCVRIIVCLKRRCIFLPFCWLALKLDPHLERIYRTQWHPRPPCRVLYVSWDKMKEILVFNECHVISCVLKPGHTSISSHGAIIARHVYFAII